MARFIPNIICSLVLLTFLIIIVINNSKKGVPMQEFVKRRSEISKFSTDIVNVRETPKDAWSIYLPYLINPTSICDSFNGYTRIKLLVLVKSSTEHFHIRSFIRCEANLNKEFKESIKTVFLLGQSTTLNKEILEESRVYGDIVQGSFMDTYRNLTMKTIMGYRWSSEHCANADYLVLKDEDYRFNFRNLFNYFKSQKEKDSVFTGHLIKNGGEVIRDPKNKWYVSREEYPQKTYPPYFPGGANILSIAIAKKLASNFHLVKIIKIEDAYIGLVAKALNITLTDSKLINIKNCENFHKNIACRRQI
uniref:Hexosyltransferase n=1 Tax=Crassostrea virginica TaxID=6565 RepID=A0A8B8EY65_CRAVI|nr:beta-1,3-galactosyltransferase 1-like [Crassostrea virginica]